MRRRALLATLLLAHAPHAWAQGADEVVVIVHKDNALALGVDFAQRVYLGQVKSWPDGSLVLPFDLPETQPVREQFNRQRLQRSVSAVKALWSQLIFTGRGHPPKVLPSEAEMLRMVGLNPHAIGYLRRSQLGAGVRVLGE